MEAILFYANLEVKERDFSLATVKFEIYGKFYIRISLSPASTKKCLGHFLEELFQDLAPDYSSIEQLPRSYWSWCRSLPYWKICWKKKIKSKLILIYLYMNFLHISVNLSGHSFIYCWKKCIKWYNIKNSWSINKRYT